MIDISQHQHFDGKHFKDLLLQQIPYSGFVLSRTFFGLRKLAKYQVKSPQPLTAFWFVTTLCLRALEP